MWTTSAAGASAVQNFLSQNILTVIDTGRRAPAHCSSTSTSTTKTMRGVFWSPLYLLALAHFGSATPLAPRCDDMEVRHAWTNVPAKWHSLGAPADGTTIDLRIKLNSRDSGALVAALYDVSDPESAKYVVAICTSCQVL